MARKFTLAFVTFCFLVTFAFAPVPASAQAVYGSILGTVTDPSGAAVPNAKVTVTNVNKGTSDTTTTNESGNYTVTHLIPDNYAVKVEAPGFKVAQTPNVVVSADTGSRVDLQMQVGAVSEAVEVTAEAPQLKTDRADVATTFNERAVENLPLLKRNFTSLLLASPGTQLLTGWNHAATENPQGSQQIFVDGQHFSGTGYELDGTDNQDPILGIIVINPNLDSVTETKITTADYDAEFGKAIAGIVATQTKSGTNAFHGSLFEYRSTDATTAKDPFANPDPVTKKIVPPNKWNQFGGSIGGPIVKDKLFFFGDYQGTRQVFGQTQQVTVPTNLVRTTCLASSGFCDLSEYLGKKDPATGLFQGQIYNPQTDRTDPNTGKIIRDPFGPQTGCSGNCIPVSQLSPQALAVLQALPAPTQTGINNNLSFAGSGPFNADNFDARIDDQTTEKFHLFGRYSMQRFTLSGKGVFGALGGPGLGVGGLAGNAKTSNHSVAAGFDYAVSPTLLTDFRFGFFRYHVNSNKFDPTSTAATDLGIPGLNTSDPLSGGLPGFFIDNQTSIGEALNIGRCNCPLTEAEHQQQYVNNWTKARGNHNFKFGADLRWANNLRVPSDANRTGQLSFNTNGTANQAAAIPGGVGLATFLLGDVTNLQRYVSASSNAHETQKRFFFYAQDIFRATQKLTVNYGLRWEYYSPEAVNGKGLGGFGHLSTGEILVAGYDGINDQGNVKPSYKLFAPRFGIAYEMTPKTVLRMGYGRSFDIGVFGSIFGHTVTQNLPVLVNQNISATQTTGGTNDYTAAFLLGPGTSSVATGAPVGPPSANINVTIPASGILPLQGPCTPVAPATTCNVGQFNTKTRPDYMRLPTLDAWNVTIQRQITPTLSGEVGYVGNKGTHVFIGNGPSYNANTVSIAGFGDPNLTQAQRRPFYNKFSYADWPGVLCCSGDIDWRGDEASSNYHSLQARLSKRFSQGLQFQTTYTWSKAMGYGFGDNADYYANNPRVVYGRVDFNRAHVLLLDLMYELPFGKGHQFASNAHGVLDYLIGGWQISTITSVFSGLPFTPSYSECGNDRDTGPCRPSKASGSFKMGLGDFNAASKYITYFTPVQPLSSPGATSGAFARPASGTFGNWAANSLTGPGNWTSDASILKNFPIGERVRGQFRVEAFNVFNHMIPGFSQNQGNHCIDCDPATTNAGRATSLEFGRTMRNLQFGLRFSF